jgi:hypothetical protein
MFPEIMVIPMREELSRLGIQELRAAAEVDRLIQHSVRPDKMFSVFAGQDKDATERARSYFTGYPPSSPSIAVMQDGKLVHMMQRSDIEHREAIDIANELKSLFDKYCERPAPANQ